MAHHLECYCYEKDTMGCPGKIIFVHRIYSINCPISTTVKKEGLSAQEDVLIIICLLAHNIVIIHYLTVYENAGIFLKASTAMSCLNSALIHVQDLFLFIVFFQNKLNTKCVNGEN